MEREKLEAELRQAQQRLRHIVVSSPAVLFTLSVADDRIQCITWISENIQQILGYPQETALGSDWFVTNIHPEDRDRIAADISVLFTRGQVAHEYRFRHGDGSDRWTRCDLRLIRDESGKSIEAVGALLDVTERKRSEERESKLREQLLQAQKLESVGRLAGGIAHDFNNLLTVINGYSAILLTQLEPDSPMHDSVSEIRMAGERGAALSRQLLIFSRKQIVQPTEVNLNDIIAEVERMLGRVIGEHIRLKSILNPSLGRVLADPGQLHQVLMNLAVNARDAMRSGGTLLIETDNVDLGESYANQHTEVKPGAYVRLSVTDTGVGMTKDVMSRLFEPFFTTKQPGEGTGLGLATVYGIIKQAGGTISVYSEPGEGTTFTIYLPRLEAWATTLAEAAHPQTLHGTETILVVEDNEQLRKMTAVVLRRYGYNVLEAADPKEALLCSEQYPETIHLLLTDVVMPGSSGRELANQIKAVHPSTKTVFMSGYSEPAIMDRGLLDSGINYLQKPFSPETLATTVREVLGLPSPKGTILVVGDEPQLRHSLRRLLTGAGYDVLEARNGTEAVQHIQASQAEVAILDVVMHHQDVVDTVRLLSKNFGLKIIAISEGVPELLRAAELLGARASLTKPLRPDEVLEAVKNVLGGNGD